MATARRSKRFMGLASSSTPYGHSAGTRSAYGPVTRLLGPTAHRNECRLSFASVCKRRRSMRLSRSSGHSSPSQSQSSAVGVSACWFCSTDRSCVGSRLTSSQCSWCSLRHVEGEDCLKVRVVALLLTLRALDGAFVCSLIFAGLFRGDGSRLECHQVLRL